MTHVVPRVRITDVSPRDGLQNESVMVPAEGKAELARLLLAANVDEVELTSFVSPKWVPQLGDAARVCELVSDHLAQTGGARLGDATRGPMLSALAPNAAGLTNLLAANEAARAAGVHTLLSKVSVFTAASESFAQRNTNASIAQTLERFAPMVQQAHGVGLRVRGYVSCVIACPFEGAISPAKVRRAVDELLRIGVDEIDLGDTIGAATPSTIRALLHEMHDLIAPQARDETALTLHLHDTFGQAGECVREALALGVRSFDGSVAGLGGCPYASLPGKPAPGNIATELIVSIAKAMGFACSVDEARLRHAAEFARTLTGRGPMGRAHP